MEIEVLESADDITVIIDGNIETVTNYPELASLLVSKATGIRIDCPIVLVGEPMLCVVVKDNFYGKFSKIAEIAGQ